MYIITTYEDWVENYDSADYIFGGWEPQRMFYDIEHVLNMLVGNEIPASWECTDHYEPGERISRAADQILAIRSGHKLGARELFSIDFRAAKANTMALGAGCHFIYEGGNMSAELMEKIIDFQQAVLTCIEDPMLRVKVYRWTAKMHVLDNDWIVIRSFKYGDKPRYSIIKVSDILALLPIVCERSW